MCTHPEVIIKGSDLRGTLRCSKCNATFNLEEAVELLWNKEDGARRSVQLIAKTVRAMLSYGDE